MSRIGYKSIELIQGASISIVADLVVATGPKGEIKVNIPRNILIEEKDRKIIVTRKNEDKVTKSLHGLVRSLINNAVIGVTEGFQKKLEINGVGYRASLEGNNLILNVGYSHPVKIDAPEGITFKIQKNTITVEGIDKQLVGQVASNIRMVRKPEPYKGKGIKYSDEIILRKAGKAAKAAGGE